MMNCMFNEKLKISLIAEQRLSLRCVLYGLMGLWLIPSHRQSNVGFATAIAHLQESPKCQRLPFSSFLLLPFQRITRIKILTEVDKLACVVHSM